LSKIKALSYSLGLSFCPAHYDKSVSETAYLSLGSNVGDRVQNLREAVANIRGIGDVVAVSSLYETEPVEFTEQSWFLNCAVAITTELAPEELMPRLLEIEREMGRERTVKKGPRRIDIDIVLFGDQVIETPELRVPHPAMHERRFVLEPMVEIAAAARHPVLKKSVRELLQQLPVGDALVKRFESAEWNERQV
jgi:2-amino-4-hydroxy-6-hydroxymethyldihydropteridine diphosphokinase